MTQSKGIDALTFDADITSFEIRLEVIWARLRGRKHSVRDSNRALASRRALVVGEVSDVSRTAHVTVVLFDATTQLHPTVVRVGHDDNETHLTGSVERLRFTEDSALPRKRTTTTASTSSTINCTSSGNSSYLHRRRSITDT